MTRGALRHRRTARGGVLEYTFSEPVRVSLLCLSCGAGPPRCAPCFTLATRREERAAALAAVTVVGSRLSIPLLELGLESNEFYSSVIAAGAIEDLEGNPFAGLPDGVHTFTVWDTPPPSAGGHATTSASCCGTTLGDTSTIPGSMKSSASATEDTPRWKLHVRPAL